MTNPLELAQAALEAGKLDEAEQLCRDGLETAADDPAGLLLLGRILGAAGRPGEAVEVYERAREADPTVAETRFLVELSALLHGCGRREEAVGILRQAVDGHPNSFHGWYNLGSVLLELRDDAEAVPALEQARRLEPESPEAAQNLGQALYGLGAIDQALAAFAEADRLGQGQTSATMLALAWPQSNRATDESIHKVRTAWASACLPSMRSGRDFADRRSGGPDRPLRVGYLSTYFHHRNWMKPVWGLINRLDRSQFSVALFSHAPDEPLTSGYVPQAGDSLHHVLNLSNPELAELIKSQQIDVLVDLNGYSEINRLALFPLRPAPITAAWFNSYATSGVPGVDYLIGDPVVIRPKEEAHYTERILRVRDCYLAFEVFGPVPDVAPPPCESAGVFTFGSLGTLYKASSAVLSVWAEILKQTPGSRLLFRNSAFGREANRQHVLREFSSRGVATDRLILEGPAPHTEFLRTYNLIDLALDTFPYTGGTTTSEALWQGVPVLTLTGDRWLPRISESILRAAGLPEFVTTKATAYIRRAVEMASPSGRRTLAGLRPTLRDRVARSPLGDCDALARQMEGLYRQMWNEWLTKPPR